MNSHKLYEFFAASLTAVTVADMVHWALGVPAAIYYLFKCWDWWKSRKAKADQVRAEE